MDSASGAWTCRAVIAACSWYSPGRRRRTARSSFARPSADPFAIPERPVLLVERDVPAAGIHARVAARVVQQHQRQQSPDLGVVGHQPRQQPAEADRLVAELVADEPVALGGGVALVEDQVHDPQHAAQAVGQLLVGRHAVGDARVGDLALRAHDPLAHGRLGDQERTGDLAGRHASERSQRERDARRHLQRGVAAGEDQPQPVVDDRALVVHRWLLVLGVQAREVGQALGAIGHRPVPAQAIDRPPPRGRRDPRPRVGGNPVAPPHRDRRLERVLDRVLGQLEVADLSDQGGQDDRALVAKRARDRRRDQVVRLCAAAHARSSTASSGRSAPASRATLSHSSGAMIGRTSIVAHGAIGSRAACSSAASRSAQSRM